ncbi:MAG: hypothetical protein IKB79_07010 [Oscillospiraceae bacterium]|nr:hypothetical protein [Oscillospiraceae bacterium]
MELLKNPATATVAGFFFLASIKKKQQKKNKKEWAKNGLTPLLRANRWAKIFRTFDWITMGAAA